jgi:hypothetical protein
VRGDRSTPVVPTREKKRTRVKGREKEEEEKHQLIFLYI